MKSLTIFLTAFLFIFAPQFGSALLKEQDRAILEGGDRNLLPNPGFEARKSGWSITGGGTFTIETAAPGAGNLSGKWNPSATGEFFRSELIPIPEGLKNRPCSLVLDYKWAGVDDEIKINVDDGTSGLGSVDLKASATDWRTSDPITFTCPGSGSIRVELESTADAAEISLDSNRLGKLKEVQVSQTLLVAHASYPLTGSCNWVLTSASFADFPTVAACPSIVVDFSTFAVDTADNNLPDIDFDDLPSGTYLVEMRLTANVTVTSAAFGFRLSDGTTNGPECSRNQDTASNNETSHLTCSLAVTYPESGPRNFKIQGRATSGEVKIFNAGSGVTTFKVWKVPGSAAEAITFQTVGWHVDVNIGGGNPDLGSASVASYTEITDSGLDLVVNPGSEPAEIACIDGTPPEGLDCNSAAVDESVGVAFNTIFNGEFKVCAAFSHEMQVGDNSKVGVIFQLAETPLASTALTQLGKDRTQHLCTSTNTGASSNCGVPVRTCGTFIFNSVGKKVVRLFYEQNEETGNANSSLVLLDRLAASGQRDLHWTVRPLNQQMPTPVFTGLKSLVRNLSGGGMRFFTANITCQGSPVIHAEDGGDWISGITRTATGRCTIDLNASVCSTDPHCSMTPRWSTPGLMCGYDNAIAPSPLTVPFKCKTDASADSDARVYFECSCLP